MCVRPRCSVLVLILCPTDAAVGQLQRNSTLVLNFRVDHPEQDLGHVTDIPVLLAISYFTVMECSTVTDPSTFSTTVKTIQ